MGKRAATITRDYLEGIFLPVHASTYTVIPYATIIDTTLQLLTSLGLEVERELYRCNQNAEVAQGIYHIKHPADPEMGMMFTWANSYDKSMRFKCAVGAYGIESQNCMVAGDLSAWSRKHTGTADQEAIATIQGQLATATKYYAQLIQDKDMMKPILVSESDRAGTLGRMLLELEYINMEQLGIIRDQIKKPAFDYNADPNSLWVLYNHITYALRRSHPKVWIERQRQVHWFLCGLYNIGNYPVSAKVVFQQQITGPVVQVVAADTNQVDLLDLIAEVEIEQVPVQEVEPEALIPEVVKVPTDDDIDFHL